jgi:predicted outer membrane repeat protein
LCAVLHALLLAKLQCAFVNNSGRLAGGALYSSKGGAITATQCSFVNNSVAVESDAAHGGAAYLGAPASFSQCAFINNSAAISGGALYAAAPNITLTDCVFDGNTAALAGGSIMTLLLQQTEELTDDQTATAGALQPPLVPLLTNTTLAGSEASCCHSGSSQAVDCVDQDFRTASNLFCCAAGSYIDAEGCQPCTDELSCSTVGTDIRSLELAPGLWRPQLDSLQTFECYSKAACSGGSSSGSADDYCSKGYTGPCK